MKTISDKLRKSLAISVRRGDKIATIIEQAKDHEVVLLGEASHGTHEYYTTRSDITKALVRDHGFRLIAVEGDWPSCFEVNEYIKGRSRNRSPGELLSRSFERWPRWMWANEDMEELVEWLRIYNKNLPKNEQVGFYGLDVYSLWESLDMLVRYFEDDALSLEQVYRTYSCFEPYARDGQKYAYTTHVFEQSCEDEAVRLLKYILKDHRYHGPERNFSLKINALVIKNAEHYYRSMVQADGNSWNIRDRHMIEILGDLRSYFAHPKTIVWAHNTHIGDARATHMGSNGLVNIGQLIRTEYKQENVYIVGFGSYTGSVLAARSWGSQEEIMTIPEAQSESWESLFHEFGKGHDLLFLFDSNSRMDDELTEWRGHRAVGVVYDNEDEGDNYVPTNLPERYDAFYFIDTTQAITPLASGGEKGELETFPSGV